MRKGYILLCIMVALCVTACQNRSQGTDAEGNNGCCAAIFDTLRIKEYFLLDTIDANSPALKIDIELLVPINATSAVADNMNACISFAAFGCEGMSAAEAADSTVRSMKNEYLELRNEYINEKAVNPDAPWFNGYYTLRSNASEGRNGCICYVADYEIYSGGAHPNNIISCVNIDTKTGREIALQDIFAPDTDEQLTERLTNRLAQHNGVKGIEGLNDIDYLVFNEMYITNNFILGKDSIFFLYNNYEIAPYYKGRSRIGFKYDELNDLLKEGNN